MEQTAIKACNLADNEVAEQDLTDNQPITVPI